MENRVKVGDLTFQLRYTAEQIRQWVKQVAQKINADYAGKGGVIFIGVLNGAFIFLSDLVRELTIDCEVDFIRVSSYEGTHSTGKVNLDFSLKHDIKGRHVVLVDDILDTGLTLFELRNYFQQQQPGSLEICVFCRKPTCLKHDVAAKYCALEIDPEFIVGYGLDYNEKGRGLPDIYKKVA